MRDRVRRGLLKSAYRLYGLRWRLLRPITIGVRIMLISEGNVILVKHSYQDEWCFPGGGVKKGESLTDAAMREAYEETGAVILDYPALQGVYTNFHQGKSDHVALFVSEHFRLEAKTDRWEIDVVRSVPLGEVSKTGPKVLRERIAEYRDGRRGLASTW